MAAGGADGIHAHEKRCDMYYQCSGGHRFENQKCPKDLLFNGEVCDWADSKKAQRNCRGIL